MPLIVLDLVGPPAKISGLCSRRLLEVRAGLFVGSLSARAIEELWNVVEDSTTRSAALIYPAKNELGMSIRSKGASRYRTKDFDGLLLIAYCAKGKTG